MSRNVFLTLDEWTQIRQELGIKRKKCKIMNRMQDEYWAYDLSPNQLKDWKKTVKTYPNAEHCFSRAGVYTGLLDQLKSQHLINRLCQQDYRSQDLMHCDLFNTSPFSQRDCDEDNRKRNFYNWIGWAFSSIKDLDIYTSKEELNAIWLEMCKEVRNGKETWFDWDLRRLFQDVKTSLSSEVVAS